MRRVGGIVAVSLAVVLVSAFAFSAASEAAWKRCGATPPGQQTEAYPAWRHSGWSVEATGRGFTCISRDDDGREAERLHLGWPPF